MKCRQPGRLIRDKVFIQSWAGEHLLMGMCQNARLSQGKQFRVNHIACPDSGGASGPLLPVRECGTLLKSKFADANQGPASSAVLLWTASQACHVNSSLHRRERENDKFIVNNDYQSKYSVKLLILALCLVGRGKRCFLGPRE